MNFFESQDNARTSTKWLLFYFTMAVVTLIIVTNISIMGVFIYFDLQGQPLSFDLIMANFNWEMFAWISLGILAVISGGSLYKMSSLSAGGRVVAQSLGGEKIDHNTQNHQQKVLLNVVEEMAIASGTPVPPVYLLKNENAINAFAAGYSTDDAVIGVTQGALDNLDRAELQGVIAHEFSHILNGDMRLNMRLVSVLHGILIIALIGYRIMQTTSHSSRSKNNGNIALMGLGFVVIGYTGVFFGNIIKASVSRQREYLADASAVQFTRDNQGIANALKKIGGIKSHGNLETSEARSFSHAFFADAIKSKFGGLFSTHPPLNDRIKKLDPLFRGKFKEYTPTSSGQNEQTSGFAPQPSEINTSDIGNLATQHIQTATNLIASIPSVIKPRLYNTESAESAIYALLVGKTSKDKALDNQIGYLKTQLPEIQFEEFQTMLPEFQDLAESLRLPVLEIALPNLRSMSKINFYRFEENLKYLINADNQLDLFEWTVFSITTQYLKTEFETARVPIHRHKDFAKVATELNCFLQLILDQCVKPEHHETVKQQVKELFSVEVSGQSKDPSGPVLIEDFAGAVIQLRSLYPKRKEQLLKIAFFMMTQDDEYCHTEQELMRAIAETLGCPMPVFQTLSKA
ncbi:M48 family metallopeptidase [Glaciecola sp. 1036]|uniref:M48 family metallopeptidase n=1 Tax=Alteromonadaceae TaxID=72275 RepID=UPI003CFD14AF